MSLCESCFKRIRFNPTLVRFCQQSLLAISVPENGFNPTLVRFCPGTPWLGLGTAQWFQSHLGSILPRFLLQLLHRRHVSIPPWFDFALDQFEVVAGQRVSFNPTLVRFCQTRSFLAHMLLVGFNPTLVRFCPARSRCCRAARRRFNPTLVRFCRCTVTHNPTPSCVSIPPWFDFAPAKVLPMLEVQSFQSHLGSILPAVALQRRAALQKFQSHLGSILPLPRFLPWQREVLRFNPTLVRFCPYRVRNEYAYGWVSIPPWFDFAESSHASIICVQLFQSHLGSILPW